MSTSNRRYAGVQVRVVPAAVLACLLLAACDHRDPEPAAQGAAAPPAVAYEAHVAAGGVAPPGGTLSNPHQGDKAVAAAGANLFTAMNCDGCHGPEGSGAVGPNLGDGRWRYGGADAEVFAKERSDHRAPTSRNPLKWHGTIRAPRSMVSPCPATRGCVGGGCSDH